ncbi:transcriptional Coactivator p15-domain-containing protein [Rhexocercosporidium sp. MPI-PUGE-AT-0058]|nr:transcriptional Coactivator p15-domain-containing protein [Rhexocercosporidium sp. MPI-PUGE-AT-0058]
MGKTGKRAHDEVDTYEEDDFVENDDGAARKTKKTKKAAAQSSGDDLEKFWEASQNPRRVTVQEFKGQKLINIREYYEKEGEYKPSSKGISLTVDQYKALLEVLPKLNTHLKGMDIDISASAVSEEEPEEDGKPKKRVKPRKQEKANIEATSDEDDE